MLRFEDVGYVLKDKKVYIGNILGIRVENILCYVYISN
jgi:hypothetical protein